MTRFSQFCALAVLLAAASCRPATDPSAWAPAGDRIKTRWAAEVDPCATLQEYPRPQLVRERWQCLNGLWNYAVTGLDDLKPEHFPGQMLVPFAIESSLSGVAEALPDSSALWYCTSVKVPSSWRNDRVMLNFGAVDWWAEVYVNGSRVAEHTGGFVPFSVDITPYIKCCGRQEIALRAVDCTDRWFQPRGKQVSSPHGIWYTPVSGIWQTVWMEPVSETRIENYWCTASLADASLKVSIAATGIEEGDEIVVELLEGCVGYDAENPSENVIASAVADPVTGVAEIAVPEVNTWSPASPYLYGLRMSVVRDGKTLDSADGYAAMREIGVRTGADGHRRMALNGEPLFHYGPLDQGWWPDGLYTAPTDEALRFDIVKTKEFGYNMIRKHIKVEPARWYTWCDREGVLVWQDMPCTMDNQTNRWATRSYEGGTDSKIDEEGKANYYKEWAEIMNAVRCFPCIVVWVPFNEAWGQFDTEKVVEYTASIDDSRLINPASGGNFRLCGDILDIHHYPHPHMPLYNKDYVNVLGEYGGIGLALEGHLWQNDRNWGYVRYKTGEEVTATYEQYASMLEELVKKGYSAAVYTQTTDVEGEVNGLMTYDRDVMKLDPERVAAANRRVIEAMNE